jgi:hypothetical protein
VSGRVWGRSSGGACEQVGCGLMVESVGGYNNAVRWGYLRFQKYSRRKGPRDRYLWVRYGVTVQ